MFDTALGIAYSLALLWLFGGTVLRTIIWLRSRSRFLIPLAPAPRSAVGVAGRLFLELFIFRSLARASKTTWLASLAFHYGLLWVLIVHLRFVFKALPLFLLPFIQYSGWATLLLLCGLSALLARRTLVERVRYISAPSDYLHLVLLLAIAVSGTLLKRIWSADLWQVGEFLRGVIAFDWVPVPDHAGVWLHLGLVLVLFVIFPVSKLVHGVGIVFSPTFNQRDKS